MEIRYLFSWLPCPIFFTKRFTGKYEAKSWGVFACVSNGQNDEGRIRHELKHCEDFYRYGLIGMFLLYTFSKKWRLFFELRGYSEELKHTTYMTRPLAAKLIADGYGLDVTAKEVDGMLAYYKTIT